jgi:hypothetical protein
MTIWDVSVCEELQSKLRCRWCVERRIQFDSGRLRAEVTMKLSGRSRQISSLDHWEVNLYQNAWKNMGKTILIVINSEEMLSSRELPLFLGFLVLTLCSWCLFSEVVRMYGANFTPALADYGALQC